MIGPCAQVTAARWGDVERHNVFPWIIEADRAWRVGDEVAFNVAMERSVEATSSNMHWFNIYALAAHPLLAKADQPTQLVALTELVGMSSSLPFPSTEAVVRACRSAESITDERKSQCLAIASALSKGSTHLEASLGALIGKAVGWTEEQESAVRKKASAIHAANISRVPTGDSYSCGFLEMMKEKLPALERHGEIGAGEEMIRRSGKSEVELVEQFRTGTTACERTTRPCPR